MAGHDNHPAFREPLPELTDQRNSVHDGHVQIHQDNVCLQVKRSQQGLLSVLGLPGHLHLQLLPINGAAYAVADNRLIISQQNLPFFHAPAPPYPF
ncbi:hypothetical protein D3C81_1921890 [compost metagenome]